MKKIDIFNVLPIDYHKLNDGELKSIIKKSDSPNRQRTAAIELYNRGDKELAIKFMISQMNLYKDQDTDENTKRETCMAAAIALGQLKNGQAIEPLFDALGIVSNSAAAYALAKINGAEIEERLLKLIGLETLRGIHAIIALGFMKKAEVVHNLVELFERKDEFRSKYKDKIAMELFDQYVFKILGSYKENRLAKSAFLRYLTKEGIKPILEGFVSKENYFDYLIFEIRKLKQNPSYLIYSTEEELRNLPMYVHYPIEQEWEITKNYGWDNELDAEEKKFVFSGYLVDQWVSIYKTPCPFKSDTEAKRLRDDIIEDIWWDIKKAVKI